jgi:L-ascorbate 6-phosphate lactonase
VEAIGVVVQHSDGTLHLVGDSLYSERLHDVRRFRPEILLCCINGRLGNMDYREAARLAQALDVRVAIPCHYGLFAANTEDPRNSRAALAATRVTFFELQLKVWQRVDDILTVAAS